MTDGIHLKITDAKNRRFGLALQTMAQRRPHPRHQVTDIERLMYLVIRTKIEGIDLLGLALTRGEDDDRHI